MIEESVLQFEEKVIFALRSLYRKHGYLPYKMSKFEEYELYLRNKDFLVSDRVIAFNDTNGKLMALKPDVTLSIIKNGEDVKGVKQKVYYNENVYRVSESTHRFKEIMQTGLECIGDIDIFDIYEVITLAAESLSRISDKFYIEISNMDVICSLISEFCDDSEFIAKAMGFISQKNAHDLKILCGQYGVSDEDNEKISLLISLYGDRNDVINGLLEIYDKDKIGNICRLSEMLDNSPFSDKIKFDFSVINDMNYYNGFVFKGFVDGIYCGVLAGGQYDNMMKKMDRNSGAIGFALYLDRLEELYSDKENYDIDCLLLYDDKTDLLDVLKETDKLTAEGISVSCQKNIPEKLRYKTAIDLRKGRE
ncbi:MAG: ATP phosphoribosyltransferase regulatory subunit [Oscillospiraceae bacterium]|nr:ATP phosphoribosyltransferase regulatory subunit [Oscillospiraceae bacterium]